MKKLYVVSSTYFDSLSAAEIKLADWQEAGILDESAKVYEVAETYVPIIKCVLCKYKVGKKQKEVKK